MAVILLMRSPAHGLEGIMERMFDLMLLVIITSIVISGVMGLVMDYTAPRRLRKQRERLTHTKGPFT